MGSIKTENVGSLSKVTLLHITLNHFIDYLITNFKSTHNKNSNWYNNQIENLTCPLVR